LAEGGDENSTVDDEEVDVGGGEDGEAPAGDFAGLGEGNFDDFERFALGAGEGAEGG
jgi:hypothetical protein